MPTMNKVFMTIHIMYRQWFITVRGTNILQLWWLTRGELQFGKGYVELEMFMIYIHKLNLVSVARRQQPHRGNPRSQMHREQYHQQHKLTNSEKEHKHRFNEGRPCRLRPRGKKGGGFLLISVNQYIYSNRDRESSASALLSSTIALTNPSTRSLTLEIQTALK